MQLQIVAIGTKMPDWVTEPFREYQKRMPNELQVTLKEVSSEQRNSNQSTDTIKSRETNRLLQHVPPGNTLIALDEKGKSLNTEELSQRVAQWQQQGQDVSLLVGGPDGLDHSQLQDVAWRWSLSPLTLPHPLVRIVLAEQLYRAWSLSIGHPYHRR
ncbi:23S rRNA (pseudouridine(1915)-N(3))-methyltransferase RlmH [bacterium]|nr:23S rRNA (pseudouridine(1915)-N(3))-methyltransferase RlmH [bacterium]